MISLNMIRMTYRQLVYVAFSRFNAHGQNSLFICKRALHKPPNITVASVGRLKRENFRHTKYESAFSEWKILIGPSDWKDHSMGKEGAEKYRTQNLPNFTCCPAVYKLGIAILLPRGLHKLVIPVYVGQADNVRTRLQQYGRDGAHLEHNIGSPNVEFIDSCRESASSSIHGHGLFSEIFSKGFPIVYRWAPMKSKKEAEEIEDQLLRIYDYSWNRRNNGDRRPDDIHRKLERCAKESHYRLYR